MVCQMVCHHHQMAIIIIISMVHTIVPDWSIYQWFRSLNCYV